MMNVIQQCLSVQDHRMAAASDPVVIVSASRTPLGRKTP